MLSQLIRVASAAGSYAGAQTNIEDTATSLPVRRVGNNLIDGRSHPGMNMDSQLDAFRGTTYAAVDKIAKRVAQVPMRLIQCEYSKTEDDFLHTPVHVHPFRTLFNDANGHRPHEEYSVWELVYTLAASLDMTGESWWLVERDKMGVPSRVTPLPSNRMTIVFNKQTGLIAGYFYTPKGATIEEGGIFIPKRDWSFLQQPNHWTDPFICYFRYPSPRGIEDPRGWSPVKAAAYAYDINLYEQIYKKNFLQQGAQLGGILQSEVALSKDQIEEYLEQFKIRHSGINKAGLPMVLPKMLKWSTTEPSPRDMQWAEAINLTSSQILQIYGISDAKLGRADIGNRNTADAMDVTFNREVIQSRLDIIMAKLNTEFLPVYPGQTEQLYFSAKFDDPVPGDGEMAMKRENQDIINGVRTPNEIRKSRNDRHLTPFGKYGDQIYKALNMLPVDPFDVSKLAISQDDVDLLGFITPDDQAALDAEAANQAADNATKLADAKGTKQDGQVDGQASNKGKKDAKKSFGRSLQRSSKDEALDTVVNYLVSSGARETWRVGTFGVIETAIINEVDLDTSLLDLAFTDIDVSTITTNWSRGVLERIDGINRTTANSLIASVESGLRDGESLAQIITRINDVFQIAKVIRAPLIARTEILGASNYAASAVYAYARVPYKRWLADTAGDTRDSHLQAHMQLVRFDEKFTVGEVQMDYPGDATAPAAEVVGCKCSLIPEFDDTRSMWNDQSLAAVWEAFDVRTSNSEIMLADAARLVFEQQRAAISSILGQFR